MKYAKQEDLASLSAEDRQQKKRLFAHMLRKVATANEKTMRRLLPAPEWQFQVPMFGWIADFYSVKYSVIVELDGPRHLKSTREDAFRDEGFLNHGIFTIRVKDQEVVEDPNGTLRRVLEFCQMSIADKYESCVNQIEWLRCFRPEARRRLCCDMVHGLRGYVQPNGLSKTLCGKHEIDPSVPVEKHGKKWTRVAEEIECATCKKKTSMLRSLKA